MQFSVRNDCLYATSGIHFGPEPFTRTPFSGRPHVALLARRNKIGPYAGNTMLLQVVDEDDYMYGLVYTTDDEHFIKVFHELVNWMKDHEDGISSYEDFEKDIYTFMPYVGGDAIVTI